MDRSTDASRDVCPYCEAAIYMPTDGSESRHACVRMPLDLDKLVRLRIIGPVGARSLEDARRSVGEDPADSPSCMGPFLPLEPPLPILVGDLCEWPSDDLSELAGLQRPKRLRAWLEEERSVAPLAVADGSAR